MLKIGLVGLPNAGKSTLFNFLTKGNAAVANYSFTTIKPNIGIMPLYDKRLIKLKKIYNSQAIINSYVKFWDIAGLIKDAHIGVGLGNKFLAHIREVDAICYVVNGFQTDKIDSNTPLENFQIIQLEIVLSDKEYLKSFLIKKPNFWIKYNLPFSKIQTILKKCISALEEEKFITLLDWTEQERNFLNKLNLLSTKKFFVTINVAQDFFLHEIQTNIKNLTNYLNRLSIEYVFLPVILLRKLSKTPLLIQTKLKNDFNYHLNGMEDFSQKILKTFGLKVFYTCGKNEVHSWLFRENQNARICAGLIHTEFSKKFIRANVISFQKLIETYNLTQSIQKIKTDSKGADYILKDGDICHFLIGR